MTAFKPLPILFRKTADRQTDDLQRGFTLPIQQLQGIAPTQGAYLTTETNAQGESVAITFTPGLLKLFLHKLQRPYVGWIPCRFRNFVGPAVPFLVEVAQNTEFNSTQISLLNISTSTFTVDLWVY